MLEWLAITLLFNDAETSVKKANYTSVLVTKQPKFINVVISERL